MEVDNDNPMDGDLLQRFSCMGTNDKEVLISQLQKLLGDQVNTESATFWLDMNNWNLQAAVCSYFDYECPSNQLELPSMTLISDVTIGEGEEVPPNTRFTKTWRIQNSGTTTWPAGCCLRFLNGDQLCDQDRIIVGALDTGEVADVSVEMLSPHKNGIYQGQWRMATATGHYFGEVIWCIITVKEGGLLSLTQQMSNFSELGHQPSNQPSNPFTVHRESVGNAQSAMSQAPDVLQNVVNCEHSSGAASANAYGNEGWQNGLPQPKSVQQLMTERNGAYGAARWSTQDRPLVFDFNFSYSGNAERTEETVEIAEYTKRKADASTNEQGDNEEEMN